MARHRGLDGVDQRPQVRQPPGESIRVEVLELPHLDTDPPRSLELEVEGRLQSPQKVLQRTGRNRAPLCQGARGPAARVAASREITEHEHAEGRDLGGRGPAGFAVRIHGE